MTALDLLKGMKRTQCKNGHPLTSKNTYRRRNGVVNCRLCAASSLNALRKRARA